ncbi:MAG: Gfo/Idh/MocA family oxidoreductase [Acidobacteriia bacterium]|nr:Gfo/Idh/MocA family oxidoreductase [Terriglobia bacterium]
MLRRTFTQLLGVLPAATRSADIALITHAGGPHLSAYIEGLAQTPEAGKVWLCDPATESQVRKGLGNKLAGVYPSPRELFQASKPHLAIIPMEAALAPPAIDAALNAGCHVMAEKPACVRAEDFARLAAKANARKLHLMLALANRVDPVMLEARRLVQSGAIGKIYGMEMHTIADQTRLTAKAYHETWTAKKSRAGGGHLIWLGIHWLDLAVYITGSRITQVAGFTGNVGGQPIDTEDSAAIALKFANGTFGTLTSGYYIDRGKHLFIKVWGSDGWLEVHHDRPENPLEWFSSRQPGIQRMKPTRPFGYTPWVNHVVRVALGIEPAVLTANDSLHALETVFAGYKAAETGRTQTILTAP